MTIKDSNKKDIILKNPLIIDLPNDKVRLSCDIYDAGEIKTLYYEADKKWKEYLCYERSDAFIIAILPYAMLSGQDIYCEAPMTETLLHNINEILIPNLVSGTGSEFKLIKINANVDNTHLSGIKISTGVSLGVDSFYTIFQTINSDYNDFKLNHLLNIRRPYEETKFAEHYNTIEKATNTLNLPVTSIITNVRTLWKSFHGLTHIYTNLGAAFALRKLINTYYYSTAYGLNEFSIAECHKSFPDDYLLLLAYCFTIPDFNVLMGGAYAHRHEKIIAISDYEIVQKNLKVCDTSSFNCNVCGKCKRSLMEFDLLGVLDNYREVFDVDYYLNNKAEYFTELYLRPNHELIEPLYKYFTEKEPDTCAQAKKLFSEDVKNLSNIEFKSKYGLRKRREHYKYLKKAKKNKKRIKKVIPNPIKKILKKIIIMINEICKI